MSETLTYGALNDDQLGDTLPDQPFLTMADVAAIGARVQGVASMQSRTISHHLYESRPGGAYEADPFPPPDGYAGGTDEQPKKPWWYLHREELIVAWFKRHPRRGAGDGVGPGVRREVAQARRAAVTATATDKRRKAARGAGKLRAALDGNDVVVQTDAGEARFSARLLRLAVRLHEATPTDTEAAVVALMRHRGSTSMSRSNAELYAGMARRLLGTDLRWLGQ